MGWISRGTDLVVLSACESGLGEVVLAEGVYGLRRSILLAGAKTVVMSLWPVKDVSTAILMERFYGNLLSGSAPDQAWERAQRDLRELTIRELRDSWLSQDTLDLLSQWREPGISDILKCLRELSQKPDDHVPFGEPWHWAAFICHGDTAPSTVLTDATHRDSWSDFLARLVLSRGQGRNPFAVLAGTAEGC